MIKPWQEPLSWQIKTAMTVHTDDGEVEAYPGDVMVLDLNDCTLRVYEVRQAKAAAK